MFSDPFLAQRAMAIASPSAGCQAIRATRDPDSEIVPDTFFRAGSLPAQPPAGSSCEAWGAPESRHRRAPHKHPDTLILGVGAVLVVGAGVAAGVADAGKTAPAPFGQTNFPF